MNRPSYKELWLYECKDRDEQLQWIRNAVNGNAKFCNSEPPYSEEEELARKIMQMHACIAELEAAQRWIPASERLPEPYTRVLACIESGYMEVDYMYSEPLVDVGIADFNSLDNVTYWMPLPKLPEAK